MKNGEELQIQLGLGHLTYVSFIRLIGVPYRTLVIFYDSKHPDVPLTMQRVLKSSHFFSAQKAPFDGKTLVYTPLIPLYNYNGTMSQTLCVTFDIAGIFGVTGNQQTESFHIDTARLLSEFLTLQNLTDPAAVSNFTKNTRKQRNRVMRTENYTAKLVGCEIDQKADWVSFSFVTPATKEIYPPDYKYMKVNPDKDFVLEPNPEKAYTITIKILKFFTWLKDTRPDSMSATPISWREIKDALEVSNVQVFSTSPSFYYQGIAYWLTQLGGSIYPVEIEPHKWNAENLHGDGNAFLDKHTAGVLNQIAFFGNQMASKLTKTLKDGGLL